MKPIVAAKTDVGRVRQGNEDSYLVEAPLYGVADGMGGHSAGEVASATAVELIVERSQTERPSGTADLATLVRDANSAIWDRAQEDAELRGMGTTCTVVLLKGDEIHLAHVGDSRAYLYRAGELSQITEDHTLVGRMVREGRLTPEEAERHPQRSIITRALGVDPEVEVDELSMPVEEGDRLLLCSDGLTSMLQADVLEEVLRTEADPNAAVNRLIELANEAGGEDNITVVLIDIAADGAASSVASETTAAPVPQRPTREHTDPDVAPSTAPPAVDTGVHRLERVPEPSPNKRSKRWPRVAVGLLVVALLLGGGFLAARYAVQNSYFIGTDADGTVTIYRGIPEEIVGMSFKDPEEPSDVTVDELPDFLQSDVQEGIKAESLEDARDKVANLEERAQDADFDKTRTGNNN